MKNLSKADEKKLIDATEQAIQYSNTGLSPNDAIEKVAREYNYTPPFIKLIASAFNKSKHVFFCKTASPDRRSAEFPLADPKVIIDNIYKQKDPEQNIVKEACFVPDIDLSKNDLYEIEKVAENNSEEDTVIPFLRPESVSNILYKADQMYKTAKDQLHQKSAMLYQELDRAMDEVVETARTLSDKDMQKVAQTVINSYPRCGSNFMRLIYARINRDMPDIQKSANAAVFPLYEPYISITKSIETAKKYTRAKNAEKLFDKKAGDNFMQDFAANIAAGSLQNAGVRDTTKLEDILKYSEPTKKLERLDPDFYNQLKEIDTRRNFLNLALYDDDLNKYEFPALVNAYNDAIQMAPEASDNRVVLRNMMIHNLETGGVKDPISLKTELDIGKSLRDSSADKLKGEKLRMQIKKLKQETSDKKPIKYYEKKDKKTENKSKPTKDKPSDKKPSDKGKENVEQIKMRNKLVEDILRRNKISLEDLGSVVPGKNNGKPLPTYRDIVAAVGALRQESTSEAQDFEKAKDILKSLK